MTGWKGGPKGGGAAKAGAAITPSIAAITKVTVNTISMRFTMRTPFFSRTHLPSKRVLFAQNRASLSQKC